MRHAWRTVKQPINPVPAIRLHHLAAFCLCNFFDHGAVISEQRTRFDEFDRFVETFSRGLYDADVVGVLRGERPDVVGFVQVGVEAFVVEGDVQVEDVAVL